MVVRLAMKPISTLMRPLDTVDLRTGEAAKAQSERSDVTAVPALAVFLWVAVGSRRRALERFADLALVIRLTRTP